jgi:hypothetical protein
MRTQSQGDAERRAPSEAGLRVEVRELTLEDEGAYTRFVASREESLIYLTLPFRDFLRAAAGGDARYFVAWREGQVCGVLPSFVRRSPELGEVWNSLPWYGSHGGCLVSEPGAAATRDALLEALLAATSRREVLSTTVILSPSDEASRAAYVRRLAPAATDSRMGQWTALPEPGAETPVRLEAVFRQKTRNLVRKALRQEFREVCTDEEWAWRFLHEVHRENMQAIGGKPKPWEHFEALRRHIPESSRRLSLAVWGGEPIAGLLLLFFGQTVEYLAPVVRSEHRARQPLSFLIFQGMLDAANRGRRAWNWGGTWITQHSLHHFKQGFGAVDRPYSYLVLARPESRARLRLARERLSDAFPYYYVYPFAQLDEEGSQ